MKTNNWPIHVATLASFAFLGLGLKAEVPPVASSANWAVHFDVAQFQQTTLGAVVEDRPRSGKEEKAIAMAKEHLGLDFYRDLWSLTLYGPDKDRANAVVLAKGDFDSQKVRDFLEKRDSYSDQFHGEHRILQWGDDGQVLFDEPGVLAFHPTGVAVLGASPERVIEALDVLDGRADARAIGAPPDAGAPYLVAFATLADLGEIRPEAALLRQSDRLALAIGESAETLRARLLVEARNVEAARQMESVIQGIQAYALLRSEGDWGGLPSWLLTATIVRDANTLHFSLDAPAERIAKFLEEKGRAK